MSVRRAGWNSRRLGSRLQHEFFYICIRLGGWRLAYVCLGAVVMAYTLIPGIRRRSRPYLSRRFPTSGGLSGGVRMFLHAFRLNLEFGKVLVDRAARGILGQGHFDADPVDKARFAGLLNHGKGLLVLTAHTGAWQWAMSGLEFTDRTIHVLYRRDEGDVDRHYFEHGSGRAAPTFIDPRSLFGGVIEVMAALRAGGVVCAMMDRTHGEPGNSVRVPFLSGDIELPLGPFVIASRLGTPVALVFTPRTGPCRARIMVDVVWDAPHDEDPARMARTAAQALERFVLENPYQFFNFFDLWNRPEA